MNYLKTLLLFLALSFSLVPTAQVQADEKSDQELRKLNLPEDDNSIYRLNFGVDAAIIATGAVISLGANSLAYSLITTRCPCYPGDVNFIDRSVISSDDKAADIAANYTVTLAMLVPIVIDYLDVGLTKSFAEDMVVYSEVLSVNFGLVTIAKFTVQRPYPYMYRKPPGYNDFDPTDFLSFYSSHTSTTVSALTAASVTLNLRHPHSVWPWVLTGVLGTSVAVELVVSAEHFTSDVIVGALMGLATGILVPGLHARDLSWWHHISIAPTKEGPEVAWNLDF